MSWERRKREAATTLAASLAHWHTALAQVGTGTLMAHCIGRPLARVGKGLEHSSGVRLRGFRGLLRKSMFLDEQLNILLDLKKETIDFKHKDQQRENRPGSSCNHLGIYISCLSDWGWNGRNLRVWVWKVVKKTTLQILWWVKGTNTFKMTPSRI